MDTLKTMRYFLTISFIAVLLVLMSLGSSRGGAGKALHFPYGGYASTSELENDGYAVDLGGYQLTIEFWFKGSDLAKTFSLRTRQASSWRDFITIKVGGDNDPPGSYSYYFRHPTLAHYFYLWLNKSNISDTLTPVVDDTWHHLALVFEKIGTKTYMKSYVDGNLNTDDPDDPPTPTYIVEIPDNLKLYLEADDYIEEFRIWNVARSQTEIQSNMYGTLSGSEEGLQLYYKFDDLVDGDNVPDIGPNNYDLDINTDLHQELVVSDAPIGLLSVSTSPVSSYSSFTAESGGEVIDDGDDPVTGRGVCWSSSPSPTTADTCTADGTGIGVFTSYLTGLDSGVLYYVRAYATNATGTSYGSQESFTTDNYELPTLATAEVSAVTETSAQSGGEIDKEGSSDVIISGVCVNTVGTPTIADICTDDGTVFGDFTSNLTTIFPGTTYYLRAYATNSEGTGYGEQLEFSTQMTPPGNSLQFNGVNDRVDLPGIILNELDVITTEFWLNAEEHGYHAFLSGANTNEFNEFLIELNNSDLFRIFIGGESAEWDISSSHIDDGIWHHIALVTDLGSGVAELYVDGVLLGTRSISTGVLSIETLMVGQEQDCLGGCLDPEQALNGTIDELRIWNMARSEIEIQTAMFQPLVGNESGLVGYYNFDKSGGTILPNFVSADLDAVISGPEWVRSGAFGVPVTVTVDVSVVTESFTVTTGEQLYEGLFPVTERGFCVSTSGPPTKYHERIPEDSFDPQTATFVGKLKNRIPGQHYNIRSYAINEGGIYYGNTLDFQNIMDSPGNGLEFDGVDDYVELHQDLAVDNNFTVEMWLNPQSAEDLQAFIGKHKENKENIFVVGYYSGKLAVTLRETSLFGGAKITGWHHLAIVVTENGSGSDVAIYRNGIVESQATLDSQIVADPAESQRPWVLGQDWDDWISDPGMSDFFQGQMDEVRIWNRARSKTEILRSMNIELVGDETDLVAYYNFDHASGDNLADKTSNSYHGILRKDPTWVPSEAPIGAPVVTTLPNTTRVYSTVPISGEVIDGNSLPVEARGIVWNIGGRPTLVDNIIADNDQGTGSFTVLWENLTPGTTYFYRAWATNSKGIGYGGQEQFTAGMYPPGNNLQFDGVDDRLDLSATVLNGLDVITTEFWINTVAQGNQVILSGANSSQFNEFIIELMSPDLLRFHTTGIWVEWDIISANIDDGNWNHFALVTDLQVGEAELYIDGMSFGKVTIPIGQLTIESLMAGQEQDCLGGCFDQNQALNGQLDELRFWNRALTAEEIQQNMNKLLSGSESDLVAYYQFDQVEGTTLQDVSDNNQEGTLVNGLTWSESDVPIGPDQVWVDDDYTEMATNDGHTWGWVPLLQ